MSDTLVSAIGAERRLLHLQHDDDYETCIIAPCETLREAADRIKELGRENRDYKVAHSHLLDAQTEHFARIAALTDALREHLSGYDLDEFPDHRALLDKAPEVKGDMSEERQVTHYVGDDCPPNGHRLPPSSDEWDVYRCFTNELDAMTIMADESAVSVIGRLTRAVKRAQMVRNGELKSPVERGWGERAPETAEIQEIKENKI